MQFGRQIGGTRMQLTDTAAVVTGGASGLGAATARALATAGAAVFAFDLPAGLTSAVPHPGITHLAVDVTDEDAVQDAFDQVARAGKPLRTVVNCAGIAPAMRILGRAGRHDIGLYRRVIQVNLVGTFTVLAIGGQLMSVTEPDADDQRGVVVNTASIAGFEGQIGQIAYACSKGGVIAMTLPAARDLAQYGIRVNTIAPGIVDTPMLATVSDEYRQALAAGVPFPRRLARPDEYAELVLMIVAHDYLNGEVIRMDGALRMGPR